VEVYTPGFDPGNIQLKLHFMGGVVEIRPQKYREQEVRHSDSERGLLDRCYTFFWHENQKQRPD